MTAVTEVFASEVCAPSDRAHDVLLGGKYHAKGTIASYDASFRALIRDCPQLDMAVILRFYMSGLPDAFLGPCASTVLGEPFTTIEPLYQHAQGVEMRFKAEEEGWGCFLHGFARELVPAPPQPRANPHRGSRAQAASAAAVTPAMPSLSQQQTMQLAARLDQLEQDKARLQDRLEALTGQAQGGVWDAPPPTPPGLSLNNDRPVRRAAGAVSRLTAERALRTITRIVNLGRSNAANRADRLKELAAARPAGNGGAGLEGGDPPEVVVASVRRVGAGERAPWAEIRGERDELRRRDARLRGQLLAAREALTALEPYAAQQDAVEECVGLLEDLMGRPTSPSLSAGPPPHPLHPASQSTSGGRSGGAGGGPAGGSSASAAGAPPQVPQGERLVARLREGVQSVVLLSSELSHLQRQLMTALALQAAAERRAAELEEMWRDSNARACAEAEAHGGGMGAGEALRGSKGWLLLPIEGSGQEGGDVQMPSPSRPADGAQGQGQEQQQGAGQQQQEQGQQQQEQGQQHQGQEGSIQTQQQQREAAEPPWKQQARELGHAVAAHQAVSDLSQLLRELQHQNAALKAELGVVKAELNRWRGFTDEQELLISLTSVQPHASPSRAGARSGASQPSLLPSPGTVSSPGAESTSTQQVVVVGSMAVRAAREARRRAAAAESQLSSVVQQRDELHARLTQIEAAAGFAGGDAADDAQDAGQFLRVKSHVMSLSKEVAALTRERDALLGLVLQAAAATAAHQHDAGSQVGSMPLTTPLFMPPELVAQVFAANDDYGGGGVGVAGAGSQLAALLSHESLLAPHSPSPALPRRAARNRMHSGGGGGVNLLPSLVPSQQQGSGAASVPESRVAGWRNGDLPGRRRGLPGPQSDPGPWEAPRPAFDAAPQPREVYRKLQKMEDRMVLRGQLTPLRGAAKDLAEGGVVANVRDADLLGLKRKLVVLEKERRDLEARAATEVRAAQTQLAAVTRQAAAAATAHTARLREVEVEREAEVARVKAEASGAITVLMQPTKGKGKAQGKAAIAKPAPQPGRWLDRDCNAALNMQRIGESRWRPLELGWWPEQGKLPAKGKEYPGLGYKRLRDKPHTAQQQQPAEAQ
ncbi:hypothetical protein QJQ45_006234 [Haematococcus lacustris]|nr:hypothetical protein QJQ45_006234 [Haematococcus lacustris]